MILVLLLGLPALLFIAAAAVRPLHPLAQSSAGDWENADDADDDSELPMGNWE